MATIRIYDCRDGGILALDLRDLLDLLGPRSQQAIWTVSKVKLYQPELNDFREEFMATGRGAGQLNVLARNRSSVSGTALTELAKATWQIIWGEFVATLPQQEAVWITIRAIDSSFYEVTTTDEAVLNKVKSAFKDVRVAAAPVTSAPIPQVPREDDR
jgi:hypothetical protein